MSSSNEGQRDLFSDVSDLDLARQLLADLHDDLPGKVTRFRLLTDLAADLGLRGTFMPGGQSAYLAWSEARSSFVHGNFVATIQLCQGLLEHLLAAFLHLGDDLPSRISFRQTLDRCKARDMLSETDIGDLERLMMLRNPLSHFRNINDSSNIDRRAMQSGNHPDQLLYHDAVFAIGLATRILAKRQFRVG